VVSHEPVGLVGRQSELERLRAFAASLRTGPGAALVRGEAGIGKTLLWRSAVAEAEEAGVRVLRTACAEIELPIAFGALADLLEVAAGEVEDRLAAPQRRALAVALGREDAEMRPDRLALARSVLATLSLLAERGPLLVAIDDVQWLDPASRRALVYALRRLPAAPVGVLATLRGGKRAVDPLALAALHPPERLVEQTLGGLSAGATGHLVHARLGRHLTRPTLARIQRASGGNPMFALELARAVAAGGAGATARLEVPSSLDELVRGRAAALPAELAPLLELAAALERPTPALLGRCLGGVERAEELLDAAARADVLRLDADGLVRFTHPLLASAVYYGLPLARRRALHRTLAERVEAIEDRDRHAALATAGADAATASLVEEAAHAAAARGALDAAAGLADEAVRLTPPELEADRHRRVLHGAAQLVEIGEFQAARDRIEPLLGGEVPAAVRAEALLLRADAEIADRLRLVELLREALEAAAGEPWLRWQALIRLAQHAGWVSGDTRIAVEKSREALEVAIELDEAALVEASAEPLALFEAAREGRPGPAPQRACSRRTPVPRLPWWQFTPRLAAGCRLMWAGELDDARRTLAAEHDELTNSGRDAPAGFVLVTLSELEWRAGRWAEAAALADDATSRLGDLNPTAFVRLLAGASAGRVDEARAIAAGVLAYCETADDREHEPRTRWALGLLELSRGDPERALAELSRAAEMLDGAGIREPGCVPLAPDLVECLVSLGRLEQARGALERLESDAAALEHRWARPAARRARALLLLARGEAGEAAALAEAAADESGSAGFPFDRARALLAAGEARRRLGERRLAAGRIGAASEIFERLGASLWLERAGRELRRASPRPSREPGLLTAAESRVAGLVAAGHTNKQVAAELFTTVSTVEAHLTRIYRKLGIRSRSELARRVAGGTLVLP
jgi:DNA-binding NarL/FixJ family response regulator